jgi:hypothetical protein
VELKLEFIRLVICSSGHFDGLVICAPGHFPAAPPNDQMTR